MRCSPLNAALGVFYSMDNGVLLHWDVVVDPYSLLKSIVVNRSLGRQLYIREEELFVEHWDAYEVPIPCGRDLAIPQKREGLLEILTEMPWTDVNSFDFNWKNIYLAIRILNFAINEGVVSIIPGKITDTGWELFEANKDDPLFDKILSNITSIPYYEGWACGTDAYIYKANANLAFALENNIDVVVNSPNFDKAGYAEKLFIENDSDIYPLQSQIIRDIELSKWSEFQYLVAEPELFFKVTNQTKKYIENQAIKEEVKWFIPKYAVDFFTFGSLSAAHLGYKAYKKWKKK